MQNKYINYLTSDIDFTRQYYYNITKSDEFQTNIYLQNQMNILVNLIKNNSNIQNIILEYRDDLISYINYNIIKNCLQFLGLKYTILFFGKIKKTKDYIYNYKNIKKINCFQLKKYKDNSIFISGFNPIYKVNNSNKILSKFKLSYSPIKSMSSEEIKYALDFYSLKKDKYLEDCGKLYSSKLFKEYEKEYKIEKISNFNLEDIYDNIKIIKLTKELLEKNGDNIIKDINSLQVGTAIIYYIQDDMTEEDLILNPLFLKVIYSSHAPNKFNTFKEDNNGIKNKDICN